MNTIRHLTQLTMIAACLAAALTVQNASAADHGVRVVQLETVVVTGHRMAAPVQLPLVTVVARRIVAEPVRVTYLPLVTVTAKRIAPAPVVVASRDSI